MQIANRIILIYTVGMFKLISNYKGEIDMEKTFNILSYDHLVKLNNKAKFFLSLSDEKNYAIAFVAISIWIKKKFLQ